MPTRSICALVFLHILGCMAAGSKLSYDFYQESCPQVERLVKGGLSSIFLGDPTAPAALLRLMFHDCQVQGCDASILLDSDGVNVTSEMGSDKNFGVRRRDAIRALKAIMEAECPRQVSCADLIILAAREAVSAAGGPFINVPLGRRDALTASSQLADASLPPATAGVDDIVRLFAAKGITLEESVALLGAHTLGVTHCSNILKRVDDDDAESGFERFLKVKCGTAGSLAKTAFLLNDLTSLAFDNQYYRDTASGRGLLRIDAEMSRNRRTAPVVAAFAADEGYFFQLFSSAFVKLAGSGVLTGDQGRVLPSCH